MSGEADVVSSHQTAKPKRQVSVRLKTNIETASNQAHEMKPTKCIPENVTNPYSTHLNPMNSQRNCLSRVSLNSLPPKNIKQLLTFLIFLDQREDFASLEPAHRLPATDQKARLVPGDELRLRLNSSAYANLANADVPWPGKFLGSSFFNEKNR